MTQPVWQDDHLTLYGGDCRDVLRELPAESVHCVVTSPPYWGLRDYGIGEKGLGLEATPEEFVANMVGVFREVRRVLRKDGTLWLNLGDSYGAFGGNTAKGLREAQFGKGNARGHAMEAREDMQKRAKDFSKGGLKPKDLVGIPWRVAFALQADGWYLRSDIIWAKPNPMPESVNDRPTKAHEYLFLLTKSPRYYYDAEAVREGVTGGAHAQGNGVGPKKAMTTDPGVKSNQQFGMAIRNATAADLPSNRNLRSVWTIATEPYPGAHFATFPRKLVEPCVKAGTSERGVCPECGAPWVREVETVTGDMGWSQQVQGETDRQREMVARGDRTAPGRLNRGSKEDYYANQPRNQTTGWRPTCKHTMTYPLNGLSEPLVPVPATVLDPFAGSGTTLLVAQSLGRRGIGIDLSPDYLKQALLRNRQTPLGLIG